MELHKNLTGADLHVNKLHAATHQPGGTDPIVPFISIDQFPRENAETDDTARIQRAIDSLPNGGTILITEPCTVSNLLLSTGICFEGVGFEETASVLGSIYFSHGSIITQVAGATGSMFKAKGGNTWQDAIYNNHFSKIAFGGNAVGPDWTGGMECINTEMMQKYKIDSCYFTGFSVAVHISKRSGAGDGSYYGMCSGLSIVKCAVGYLIDGRANVHTISGGVVLWCDLGIDIQYSEAITITGVSIEQNGIADVETPANNLPQIRLSAWSRNANITNCYLDAPISDHVVIVDNTVLDATFIGNEFYGLPAGYIYKNLIDFGVGTIYLTGSELFLGGRELQKQIDGKLTFTPINLVVNGEFETNITGWGAYNATLSHETVSPLVGTGSLKILLTGLGNRTSPQIVCVIGHMYSVTALVKSTAAAGRRTDIRISYGGDAVGPSVDASTQTTATLTFTATLTEVTPIFELIDGIADESLIIDSVVCYDLTAGTTATVADINKLHSATAALQLSALNTAPANAGATGTLGEIRITADAIFVCTATNTWVKAALATWA